MLIGIQDILQEEDQVHYIGQSPGLDQDQEREAEEGVGLVLDDTQDLEGLGQGPKDEGQDQGHFQNHLDVGQGQGQQLAGEEGHALDQVIDDGAGRFQSHALDHAQGTNMEVHVADVVHQDRVPVRERSQGRGQGQPVEAKRRKNLTARRREGKIRIKARRKVRKM